MSNKSVGKPLTMDLVFTKTKSDSLQNIKNLNLWGNDLQDLRLIQKMPNLQVVSLSVNRISSLKDFVHCNKLQELYLRKNNICDLSEIRYLVKLPSLKVLWLHDNPCAQIQNYRDIVIKHLPNLVKLDNNAVTQQQRISSQNINYQISNNRQQQQEYESQRPRSSYNNQSKWQRPQTGHSNASNVHRPPHRNSSQYQHQEEEKNVNPSEKFEKRPSQGLHSQSRQRRQSNFPKEQEITRNQNILMAVLSLMRQLDQGSLQIIRRQTDKMLQ